jgi:hypothetical protein
MESIEQTTVSDALCRLIEYSVDLWGLSETGTVLKPNSIERLQRVVEELEIKPTKDSQYPSFGTLFSIDIVRAKEQFCSSTWRSHKSSLSLVEELKLMEGIYDYYPTVCPLYSLRGFLAYFS